MDKIRVLFACIPTPGNRFMIDLKSGLEEQGCEVIWDYKEFWKCKNHFDIIHIHWPEYLSYEVASFLKTEDNLPKNLWNKIESNFQFWAKTSKIFYTRHVQYPHNRHDPEFLKLYELTFKYSSEVIHFAEYSIHQFKTLYPTYKHIRHRVIPHHNYASLPNTVSKSEARKKLKISKKTKVMLVFGNIRDNEKPLIKQAFQLINERHKVLLAPGWKINKPQIKWIRLRDFVFKWHCKLVNQNRIYRINKGFIKEEDTQYYLNAADFLFIPRIEELNSGNITLGFTYGLLTIGCDNKDIGEILKKYGNPVFIKGNNQSLKKAIQSALSPTMSEVANNNKKIALDEWSVEKITETYFKAFEQNIHDKSKS